MNWKEQSVDDRCSLETIATCKCTSNEHFFFFFFFENCNEFDSHVVKRAS